MIRAVILFIPLAIGGYSLTLSRSPWTVVLTLLAVALSAGGAALRRYSLIVGGSAVLLAGYVSALPALDTPPNVWAAVGTGLGLYLLLELAYDWIHAIRRPVGRRVYAPRIRHFLMVSAVSAAATFTAVTLGYNLALRIRAPAPFWPAILALPAAVAAAGGLVRFWIHNREPAERQELDAGENGSDGE